VKKVLEAIQVWARRRSYRRAVKQADKEHKETGRKVFVVLFEGEFIALTKRRLKQSRRSKGLSLDMIQHIERCAVYVAK
jgi:hypothetical protein